MSIKKSVLWLSTNIGVLQYYCIQLLSIRHQCGKNFQGFSLFVTFNTMTPRDLLWRWPQSLCLQHLQAINTITSVTTGLEKCVFPKMYVPNGSTQFHYSWRVSAMGRWHAGCVACWFLRTCLFFDRNSQIRRSQLHLSWWLFILYLSLFRATSWLWVQVCTTRPLTYDCVVHDG